MSTKTKDGVEFTMGMTLYHVYDGDEGLGACIVVFQTNIMLDKEANGYLWRGPGLVGRVDKLYASKEAAIQEVIPLIERDIAILQGRRTKYSNGCLE